MKIDAAMIYSGEHPYPFDKRICGLFPLERNIRILHKSGINKICLKLSEEEKSFYNTYLKYRWL